MLKREQLHERRWHQEFLKTPFCPTVILPYIDKLTMQPLETSGNIITNDFADFKLVSGGPNLHRLQTQTMQLSMNTMGVTENGAHKLQTPRTSDNKWRWQTEVWRWEVKTGVLWRQVHWEDRCVEKTGVLRRQVCWEDRCVEKTGALRRQMCWEDSCVEKTGERWKQVCWEDRWEVKTGVLRRQVSG